MDYVTEKTRIQSSQWIHRSGPWNFRIKIDLRRSPDYILVHMIDFIVSTKEPLLDAWNNTCTDW